MGLNLNTDAVTNAKEVIGANGKPMKPTAKIWLNPGTFVKFDGEEEETFVGLAQGLPLDTMDLAKTNYSSPKMRALGQAKNALRAYLLAACEGKQGGDTFFVDMKLQVRLVSDDTPVTEGPDVDAVTKALSNLTFS